MKNATSSDYVFEDRQKAHVCGVVVVFCYAAMIAFGGTDSKTFRYSQLFCSFFGGIWDLTCHRRLSDFLLLNHHHHEQHAKELLSGLEGCLAAVPFVAW
jgi:hypothetical protein